MILEIEHSLRYRYSKPVYLEPYILRLTPKSDAAQRLGPFVCEIEPKPQHQSRCVDLDGTISNCLHFSGLHDALNISTRGVVETLRVNPYDFLLHDAAFTRLPVDYPAGLQVVLSPYLKRTEHTDDVDVLVRALILDSRDGTLDFLAGLTGRIHQQCRNEYRESGAARSPRETLARARGTCRDLTVLWMDACRSAGLAARFVSGYKLGDDDDSEHHLHAWAEVYLPGGGWRGFDPSTGLAVVDRHVALAASAIPALASPGQGTFVGAAKSELEASVSISQRSSRAD
jgi:transglutaminase-like putative cysteine protease